MQNTPSGGRLLLSPEQISQRVRQMGQELTPLMRQNAPWLVLGVLRGAFIFMADLVRELDAPLQIDFIQISSYGDATASSGIIQLVSKPGIAIAGRSILLLDDVLDTGHSMHWLINYLTAQGALSVTTCVLLDKPQCRQAAIQADYVGFTLPTAFVVGYGMDMAQQYRQLPGVYQLPEDKIIC